MFERYEEMTQEEQETLKAVIGQLLSHTFLLERTYDRRKERLVTNKEYYFCERHMEFLTQYFAVAGIRLCQNTELGSIYVSGTSIMGEKLPKLATIYLLLLKLLYDEKMASVSSSVTIVTTFGELSGKVGEFRLVKGLPSMTETKRAFALLKKYQIVEFIDSPDELKENTRIIIYPCINVILMREDIIKLLESFGEEDEPVPVKPGTAGEEENSWQDTEEDKVVQSIEQEIVREVQQQNLFALEITAEKGETEDGE